MFCDQDDVWLPHKIETTLSKMKEMESSYGKGKPFLVHTDLKVVDEKLNLLSESLWCYQLSDPEKGGVLNRLLMQNIATGCSMMINRPLLDLALPIPAEAVMHDWWLALVAAAFGHIGFVAEPTTLYRQHGTSEIGAKKWDLLKEFKTFFNFKKRRKQIEINNLVMQRMRLQAAAFLEKYGYVLTGRQKEMLKAFLRLADMNFFMKRYRTIKYGFFYTGLIRNIGRFITL
jgi:hypothetical protein